MKTLQTDLKLSFILARIIGVYIDNTYVYFDKNKANYTKLLYSMNPLALLFGYKLKDGYSHNLLNTCQYYLDFKLNFEVIHSKALADFRNKEELYILDCYLSEGIPNKDVLWWLENTDVHYGDLLKKIDKIDYLTINKILDKLIQRKTFRSSWQASNFNDLLTKLPYNYNERYALWIKLKKGKNGCVSEIRRALITDITTDFVKNNKDISVIKDMLIEDGTATCFYGTVYAICQHFGYPSYGGDIKIKDKDYDQVEKISKNLKQVRTVLSKKIQNLPTQLTVIPERKTNASK